MEEQEKRKPEEGFESQETDSEKPESPDSVDQLVDAKKALDQTTQTGLVSINENVNSLNQPVSSNELEETSQASNKLKDEVNELKFQFKRNRSRLEFQENDSFFMKIINRKERRRLEAEVSRLIEDISNKESELNQLNAIEDNLKLSLEKAESKRLNEIVESFRQALEQTELKYQEFEKELLENQELKNQLNQVIIDQEFKPILEKLEAEGTEYTAEESQEFINLLREIFIEGKNATYEMSEEKRREVNDRGRDFDDLLSFTDRQLPEQPYLLSEQVRRWVGAGDIPPDQWYNQIFKLLIRQEQLHYIQQIQTAIRQAQDILRKRIDQDRRSSYRQIDASSNLEHIRWGNYHFIDRELDLQEKSDELIFEKYITKQSAKRWPIIRENPEIQKIFSQELFTELEQIIQQRTIKKILTAPAETDLSYNLSHVLLKFRDLETTPLAIVNCWRERGHGGYMPFLERDIATGQSEFSKMILGLSDEDLKQLADKKIPGLMEVIETIRNHPENFDQPEIENSEWTVFKKAVVEKYNIDEREVESYINQQISEEGKTEKYPKFIGLAKELEINPEIIDNFQKRQIENPGYQKITQAILRMCGQMIEKGSEDEQVFALETLMNHKINLNQEAQDLIMQVLNNSNNKEIVNKALQIFNTRFNNPDCIQTLIKFYPNLIADKQVKVKEILDQKFFYSYQDWILHYSFSQEFNNTMLRYFNLGAEKELTEKYFESFHQSMRQLIESASDQKSEINKFKDFFLDINLVKYLSQKPEQIKDILNWPKNYQNFFKNLEPGGIFHSNQLNIVREFLNSPEPEKEIAQAEMLCTEKIPYWKFLFFWTDRVKLKESLKNSISKYPITKIGGVPLAGIIERHQQSEAIDTERVTSLEELVKSPDFIKQLEQGQVNAISFCEFTEIGKRLVFRDYLKQVIELSRSEIAKQKADLRNRQLVNEELKLRAGDYLHGSAVDAVEPMLLSGNLSGEALGDQAMADSYPFHVDFSRLTDEYLKQQENNIEKIFLNSLSVGYGARGKLGLDGQLMYFYKRTADSWEGDKTYLVSDHHSLVLGGIPATEITGIAVRNPEKTLKQVQEAIMENGFYIPLYNYQGDLLFTPEDYDHIREDLNLSVPVEVWDYSFEKGGRLGSNPGAQIAVSGKKGPESYYVKFEYPEAPHQIWVEKLAEDIYRTLEIPMPETKVVMLTRGNTKVYGHASRILEAEEKSADEVTSKPSWKAGFVADALLANWDIPYAPGRNSLVGKDGQVYRIDSGGALIYRARGERKDEKLFSGEVQEVKEGTDHERLGFGMRQEYPGLTGQDIQEQVQELKEKLTNQAIDNLVDRARLPKVERDQLKEILKQRRDYIIEYFKK